jgi:ABC-type antimicrobial peptide transport system permease subunit
MNAGLGLLQLFNTVVLTMLAAGYLSSGSTFHGVLVGSAAVLCALGSVLPYRRAARERRSGNSKTAAHTPEART